MLDPDEEGSSKLVKRIEKYALYYLNSADLREDEDFPGYFDTDHPMMMFHSHSRYVNSHTAQCSNIRKKVQFQKYKNILFAFP